MKITIIGCGNMGSAYARRLSPYHSLFLYDQHQEKAQQLEEEGHGVACSELTSVLPHTEIIILAIKPQSLEGFAQTIQWQAPTGQFLISLLAGLSIATLSEKLPGHRIIRMMPNLAIAYGKGQIGVVTGRPLDEHDEKRLLDLAEPLGRLYWLEESMMNSFTALAGSGPAFFYAMIEAMVAAAVTMGYSAKEGQALTCQMIKSSLYLLEKSGETTESLKKKITSPGGTTEVGLKKFEEEKLSQGIESVFISTYNKANNIN